MKNELALSLSHNISFDSLVNAWNYYCCNVGNCDDFINPMEDIDELYRDVSPLTLARHIFYGDFKPCDTYFRFNGYGNLVSFDNPLLYIDVEELASYIIDNNNDLCNDDIRDWLASNT